MSADNFANPDHALQTGMLAATLMVRGVGVEMCVDEDEDYVPKLILAVDGLFSGVVIEVHPPYEGESDDSES